MHKLCVVFDLDGTLVDSENLCNQALLELLPELDEPVCALVARYRGKQLSLILADVRERLQRQLPQDFEARYRARVSELFSTCLLPSPGAKEMLGSLAYPCCVASSGPPAKIRQALRVTGLERYFGDRVYSSYEINSWKPEPGLFLHAAREMSFLPSECVVIEDSEVGLQAAARAGMTGIHYDPHAHAGRDGRTIRSLLDLTQMLHGLT